MAALSVQSWGDGMKASSPMAGPSRRTPSEPFVPGDAAAEDERCGIALLGGLGHVLAGAPGRRRSRSSPGSRATRPGAVRTCSFSRSIRRAAVFSPLKLKSRLRSFIRGRVNSNLAGVAPARRASRSPARPDSPSPGTWRSCPGPRRRRRPLSVPRASN